jgi:hypothetical protein
MRKEKRRDITKETGHGNRIRKRKGTVKRRRSRKEEKDRKQETCRKEEKGQERGDRAGKGKKGEERGDRAGKRLLQQLTRREKDKKV